MKFPYFAYLAFVILLVIDPLFVAVGLLWFGQGVYYSQGRSMLY
jgi:hypothetical protein